MDLAIPLASIEALPYVDIEMDGHHIEASGTAGGFELKGKLLFGLVHVKSIAFSSEGSGHEWDAFKEMLSTSTGILIASQVWEGGDSITRLTVKNGEVQEAPVDI
jgi:hypothetical protein